MEKRFINEGIQIESRSKDDGTTEDIITGYGIVFESESRIMGGWYPFIETVNREALNGVDLKEVVATFNHNFDNILARADAGTLKLSIDKRGLKYEFTAPNTTYGRDLVENLKNGNVRGSSFMFTTKKDAWIEEKGEDVARREILEIDQFIEVGPVTMPAYPDTTAAKRSYEQAIEERQHKVDYDKITEKLTQFKNKK